MNSPTPNSAAPTAHHQKNVENAEAISRPRPNPPVNTVEANRAGNLAANREACARRCHNPTYKPEGASHQRHEPDGVEEGNCVARTDREQDGAFDPRGHGQHEEAEGNQSEAEERASARRQTGSCVF